VGQPNSLEPSYLVGRSSVANGSDRLASIVVGSVFRLMGDVHLEVASPTSHDNLNLHVSLG